MSRLEELNRSDRAVDTVEWLRIKREEAAVDQRMAHLRRLQKAKDLIANREPNHV